MVILSSGRVASGPIISGSLQAKKQADLRAEVSAIVVQVINDNGDKVQAGDLLVRLDDTIYRQALLASQEAERVAQQSFDQAERQFNRLKALSSSGAVSIQAREDAELRRNAAQSELAATRARLAQDTLQLARTQIRAPFAGVVGNRMASNGDTAQVGKALLKVIDPSSIRFEGLVPSDQIQQVKVGQAVNFYVNGSRDHLYEGKGRAHKPRCRYQHPPSRGSGQCKRHPQFNRRLVCGKVVCKALHNNVSPFPKPVWFNRAITLTFGACKRAS